MPVRTKGLLLFSWNVAVDSKGCMWGMAACVQAIIAAMFYAKVAACTVKFSMSPFIAAMWDVVVAENPLPRRGI